MGAPRNALLVPQNSFLDTSRGYYTVPAAPPGPTPSAPVSGADKCCPQYWNQFQYKTYRVLNPRAGGGNFAVDTDTIRPGYYWKILAASLHVETSGGIFLAWLLCAEADRAVIPVQAVSVNSTPQAAGICLNGPLGSVNSTNTLAQVSNAMPLGLPVVPLNIPNGFFLRGITVQPNNSPAQNVVMEMRVAFLELSVDDPGPVL